MKNKDTTTVPSSRPKLLTLLNASGMNAKTIQATMRHAALDMTMNIYTHAETEQSRAAVEGLPDFENQAAEKTGTDDFSDALALGRELNDLIIHTLMRSLLVVAPIVQCNRYAMAYNSPSLHPKAILSAFH